MAKFVYRGNEIKFSVGYPEAYRDFPDKFGLNLMNLFAHSEVLQELLLNNELTVKIWYWYVEKHTSDDLDTALENLTPDDLEKFREAFFEEVVNFSPAPGRQALREMWAQAKKEITNLVRQSFAESSSNSLEKQE